MTELGPGGLFIFISCILGLLVLYLAWRLVRVQSITRYRGRYVPVPRTTQSIYELEEEYAAEAEAEQEDTPEPEREPDDEDDAS